MNVCAWNVRQKIPQISDTGVVIWGVMEHFIEFSSLICIEPSLTSVGHCNYFINRWV
jgi:hypothetical protein